MSSFASLPLHPLLVHVPVVLVPLLAVAAGGLAVRRTWFHRFGIVAAGLAVVTAAGTLLAAESGESLEESVTRTAALHDHTELGDQAKIVIAAFLLSLFAWVVLDGWFRRNAATGTGRSVGAAAAPPARAGMVSRVLMVTTLAFGALATVWVFRAGHSGATAVWENKTSTSTGSGDDDND